MLPCGRTAGGTAIGCGAARACAIVAALLAVAAVAPAAGARADGLPGLTCAAYTLPVRIADPGPADQTMWGQLCYRGSREPATVQLLVHGASYDHLYWNFPTAAATTPTSTPRPQPGTPP
jgi:hypothetical protein